MSGYELSRFVNLSESEKHSLTCQICQDIFKDPMVAPCCEQIYCYYCIRNWLTTSSTCPNDRQPLVKRELKNAPRVVVNMLDKLKITCDYVSNGCTDIVYL